MDVLVSSCIITGLLAVAELSIQQKGMQTSANDSDVGQLLQLHEQLGGRCGHH